VIPLYGNEVRDFRGRVIFTDLEVLKVDRATLDVVGEILAEVRDPRRKNLTVFPKDI
jgi:hypothetical protein